VDDARGMRDGVSIYRASILPRLLDPLPSTKTTSAHPAPAFLFSASP
jgi:hypothetical protein